jgi:cyclophilin family peptidyl-prolyl cis-trans isomerase
VWWHNDAMMTRTQRSLALVTAAALTLSVTSATWAQQAATPPPFPAPSEIVAAAPASDWVAIAPADLLIMTLTPDPRGGAGRTGERRVVIQLMPAPFSQGWVSNIRTLAAAHWWDGTSINRVQDNYVVQWGDADGEDAARARVLPGGLRVVPEAEYLRDQIDIQLGNEERTPENERELRLAMEEMPHNPAIHDRAAGVQATRTPTARAGWHQRDSLAEWVEFWSGWPLASQGEDADARFWPVHCYGMVGVGRNLSPDTGNGTELYTVIGHAPRHLDRNIALVGRVIEGMEHLSSLPRGSEALGFYATPEERTGIASIRIASELPAVDQPHFQYLSTESASFGRYVAARVNRRDPFFNVPAGGADICNIPVPVRQVPAP